MRIKNWIFTLLIFSSCFSGNKTFRYSKPRSTLIDVAPGWSGNSINTVIFRKNALVSSGDHQYISFYDQNGFVVLGKRKLSETTWQLKTTAIKGNIKDAHNSISIMTDGDGYLHLAWDHHNSPLRYCRSVSPGSLELTEPLSMTGQLEKRVSYPEFYRMPGGDLLFMYRDGGSGRGNLVINKYDLKSRQWIQLQSNLIDGEGKRSAYWQGYVDNAGTIHLSWVWRESPDVASNHDLCYARSKDGGLSWEKSNGNKYTLPISASNAEYAIRIPQNSELINQASMCADKNGNPFIATYWRERNSNTPQYHIVYPFNQVWKVIELDFRSSPFTLAGAGSKRIPISRPQLLVGQQGNNTALALLFRDEERGSKVSVLTMKDFSERKWRLDDLTDFSVGSWEPSFDTELWKSKKILHLFVQKVEQVDGEGIAVVKPEIVQVLECR